jgi:hypothetical protein
MELLSEKSQRRRRGTAQPGAQEAVQRFIFVKISHDYVYNYCYNCFL